MADTVSFSDGTSVEVDWTDNEDGSTAVTVDGAEVTAPRGRPAVGWPWLYVVHEPRTVVPTAEVASVEPVKRVKRVERAPSDG